MSPFGLSLKTGLAGFAEIFGRTEIVEILRSLGQVDDDSRDAALAFTTGVIVGGFLEPRPG